MSVQVEKLEKNMAKLTVEVPAENVEKAIQGAYNKMKKSINIPGFRKGKAPRQLIEKMYGKEVFYNDAIDAMLPSAYSDAVEECGGDRFPSADRRCSDRERQTVRIYCNCSCKTGCRAW